MKKRTIYIGLSLIFIIGVVSLIGTFAVDTTITEGNSSKADYLFNIVLGDRTNRQIVIPSYDSKIVDVKVSNPNSFNMSYLLYLEGTNSNISVVNIGDLNANGVIESKNVGIVRLFVQNNSGSNITISLKDIVGFESDTMTLPNNATAINKGVYYKAVVTSNDSAYGKVKPNIKLSAKNGTVKYQIVPNKGYKYKSNTCGGTVTNNILTLSNITNNISCQVVFEANKINVSLDMQGGSIESTFTEVKQHTYTVPYTGTYKLETWGAQGGTVSYFNNNYYGGYGGYSTGNVNLKKGNILYINIGGVGIGGNAAQNYDGGYNGGGSTNGTSGSDHYHTSGGGATHIATTSGLLSSLSGNLNSILIVSGGGGGGYIHTAGTGYGSLGGAGGGYLGSNATTSGSNGKQGLGGSQTAGGKYNSATASDIAFGSFGQGGKPIASWGSAGGGGYYGGGASYGQTMANGNSGGGGGSGYIGNPLLTNKYMYCYNCTTSTDTATKTYTTTNVSDIPTSDYAKSGNGAAKITLSGNINYTVTYSQGYGELATPYKKGYIFGGWYTEPNGKGTLVTSDSDLASESDHTLYAKWERACSVPTFTYTGNYEIVDDNNTIITDAGTYTGNWKIRFLSSGTLNVSDLGCSSATEGIDAFIVGGGGNGASGTVSKSNIGSVGGGGGGGGAAVTVTRLSISKGTSYKIVVGNNSGNSSFGVGDTAYFTALGGGAASEPINNNSSWIINPSTGGAGRLASETSKYGALNVDDKPGASGNGVNGNYEFNEEGQLRYGASGGSGTTGVLGRIADTGQVGGSDGGGQGGRGCSYYQPQYDWITINASAGAAGTANSGSGGGGGGGECGTGTSSWGARGAGGSGASGIVIIRNTRTSETNPPVGTMNATKSYNTINVSINATDDTGIDHYEYYLSTSATCPTVGYKKSESNTYSFDISETGTYYVCARVVDLLGNFLPLKSNAFNVSRVYQATIRYNTNGGTITKSSGGYTWTTDSTGLIYQNGKVYEETVRYGKTIDLANYNNVTFINIDPGVNYVAKGNEWVCLSGCSNVGKVYNQDAKYSTSDFCDLTNNNCTVVLGLKIVQDTTSPTCTLNANESGLTATVTDNNVIVYQGWSSSYSGSNSTSKDIADITVGTYTYYVKDKAGNKGSCSIDIVNLEKKTEAAFQGVDNECLCKQKKAGGYVPIIVVCNTVAACSCPSGTDPGGCNITRTYYYCSSGEELSGDKCISYSCPTGYSKMNNSYCYK